MLRRLLVPCVAVSQLSLRAEAQPSLPDVPAPTQYPDLQVDGEWWYYKLLDTAFPHSEVPLLPAASLSDPGSAHVLRSLPEAKYALLEFFAPWCPHCQRLAPELAKVAEVLRSKPASSGSLVSLQAVDCERSDMQRLCSWAGANVFPKLILAPRSVLLGEVGLSAGVTPGIEHLTAVSEASEVMAFLEGHVEGWPAHLPAPAPRRKGAPFFGWAQPPEGMEEPPRARAQDIAVAATTLLHTAFSTLDLDEPSKAALLDLLQLLCVAGPGGSCRRSACGMRERLERDWEKLVSRTTITQDFMGMPVSPFNVTVMDWARVEHEHRWCGRPWTEFAAEGWDWCQGRSPGTRGYTCGLWMLFHSLLAGAEEAQRGSEVSLTRPPLETVRDTVRHFFGCEDCRRHFLAVPVTLADIASPAAQMKWLWSAHNAATVRIGKEERQHSPDSPARHRWPSAAACPACFNAAGDYVPDEVVGYIRHFYGGVFADESQGSSMSFERKYEVRALAGGTVSVEVFYFTLCPHCQYFLTKGLSPLVEAQLPGDRVQINVVPMYPPLLQAIRHSETCSTHDICHFALAPLCGFRETSLRPSRADSPALLKGTRFAVCDIADTAMGHGRDPARTQSCAKKAGIDWDGDEGLRKCSEGPRAIDLLGLGSRPLLQAMTRLHDVVGFREPPSMPWVFLNGDLLSCDGPDARCTHTLAPDGRRPLPNAGTLLELICAQIGGEQAAKGCSGAGSLQQKEELWKASGVDDLARGPEGRWTFAAPCSLAVLFSGTLTACLLSSRIRHHGGLRRARAPQSSAREEALCME